MTGGCEEIASRFETSYLIIWFSWITLDLKKVLKLNRIKFVGWLYDDSNHRNMSSTLYALNIMINYSKADVFLINILCTQSLFNYINFPFHSKITKWNKKYLTDKSNKPYRRNSHATLISPDKPETLITQNFPTSPPNNEI